MFGMKLRRNVSRLKMMVRGILYIYNIMVVVRLVKNEIMFLRMMYL